MLASDVHDRSVERIGRILPVDDLRHPPERCLDIGAADDAVAEPIGDMLAWLRRHPELFYSKTDEVYFVAAETFRREEAAGGLSSRLASIVTEA